MVKYNFYNADSKLYCSNENSFVTHAFRNLSVLQSPFLEFTLKIQNSDQTSKICIFAHYSSYMRENQ